VKPGGPSPLSRFKENDEEMDKNDKVIVVKAANLSFIREPQIKPLPDSSEVPLVLSTLQELLNKRRVD
jgi:hypothetical protein